MVEESSKDVMASLWGVMSGLEWIVLSRGHFAKRFIGQLGSKDLGGNVVIIIFRGGVSPYPQTLFVTGS